MIFGERMSCTGSKSAFFCSSEIGIRKTTTRFRVEYSDCIPAQKMENRFGINKSHVQPFKRCLPLIFGFP
jgi:hypothetical protein